jgi:hypothetical protein
MKRGVTRKNKKERKIEENRILRKGDGEHRHRPHPHSRSDNKKKNVQIEKKSDHTCKPQW